MGLQKNPQNLGETKTYQYGNEGLQTSFFSTATANPTGYADTVFYPTSVGEYSDHWQNYQGVFWTNAPPTNQAPDSFYHPAWGGTDVLFRLHQFDLTEPMTNTDIMLSVLQPFYMASEYNPAPWTQWDCGSTALCLEQGVQGLAKYLVVKRSHGTPLTVTLPDGHSSSVAINQDIVGITETFSNSGIPTISTHEVSP